jgi:hypothetical protein
MRKLILIIALATTVTPAFAEDFVGDVMILKAYRNNCNHPVILEEMMAVDRAASAAGLDTWSSSFYREVEKRRKDYVLKTPEFGTQEWCEKAKQQIETDYKRLIEAEEADKSKPKAPVAVMPPEQVPNCDLFRKRFAEAARVVSLRLPSLQLHREPPDPILKDDTWKTDGMRAEEIAGRGAQPYLQMPKVSARVESAIRATLARGVGILKAAKLHKAGSSTVQRIAREQRASAASC